MARTRHHGRGTRRGRVMKFLRWTTRPGEELGARRKRLQRRRARQAAKRELKISEVEVVL